MSRTRTIAAAATVAALCALPATSAPAAPKKKVTCTKRSGDTILVDSTLRVYQTVKRVKGDPDASTVTIRFCKPGTTAASKKLDTFANTLDGSLTVQAAVRGGSDHIGLELDEQTGVVDATNLFVYRLSTRARNFSYASESPFEYAVTAGGGVALLEAGALRVFDGAGERTAATGAERLATSGDTVYWTAGGAAASTVLSGEAKRTFQPLP